MLLTHMVQAQFHPLKFKNMINTKTIHLGLRDSGNSNWGVNLWQWEIKDQSDLNYVFMLLHLNF